MSIYDRLAANAAAVSIVPEETSYFSHPETVLDPNLFDGDHLRPDVRQRVLKALFSFWRERYRGVQEWSEEWLAGSGVSYQWSAARDPGDLDCLIGVDWSGFRQDNPDFRGLSNAEIAKYLNDEMHDHLWPKTSHFSVGDHAYELTFFINPQSKNITAINPYAAYNLTHDEWTVRPWPEQRPPTIPGAAEQVKADEARTRSILKKYDTALDRIQGVANPGLRLNDEITLRAAAREGAALWEEIHSGRRAAYEPGGLGYEDAAEYRYKGAKATGALKTLRYFTDLLDQADREDQEDLYGSPLLNARDTLVNAAISRRYHR